MHKFTTVIAFMACIIIAGCTANTSLPIYETERTQSDGISSIKTVEDCNVKEFSSEADCKITKYLEENVINGYHFAGVNFCDYTVLNESIDENPLYIVTGCNEFYPVDYVLQCESEDVEDSCHSKGLDGTIEDEFERERYPYLQEGIKKCHESCKYIRLQPPVLSLGSGVSGLPVKITISEDGTMEHEAVEFGPGTPFPDTYNKLYREKSKTDVRRWHSTSAKRAEEYFGLKFDGDRWWWWSGAMKEYDSKVLKVSFKYPEKWGEIITSGNEDSNIRMLKFTKLVSTNHESGIPFLVATTKEYKDRDYMGWSSNPSMYIESQKYVDAFCLSYDGPCKRMFNNNNLSITRHDDSIYLFYNPESEFRGVSLQLSDGPNEFKLVRQKEGGKTEVVDIDSGKMHREFTELIQSIQIVK